MVPWLLKLFKTTAVMRAVIPNSKYDKDKGGTLQRSWLQLGPYSLFLNYEDLHNEEYRLANELVKQWKDLEDTYIGMIDAAEKRRSTVKNVGFQTTGTVIKGAPFKDVVNRFELFRWNVPTPEEVTLKKATEALSKTTGGRLGCINGTNLSKKKELERLHKEGRLKRGTTVEGANHLKVTGDADGIESVDIEKVMKVSEQLQQNSGKKGKGNNNGGNYQKPGYNERGVD